MRITIIADRNAPFGKLPCFPNAITEIRAVDDTNEDPVEQTIQYLECTPEQPDMVILKIDAGRTDRKCTFTDFSIAAKFGQIGFAYYFYNRISDILEINGIMARPINVIGVFSYQKVWAIKSQAFEAAYNEWIQRSNFDAATTQRLIDAFQRPQIQNQQDQQNNQPEAQQAQNQADALVAALHQQPPNMDVQEPNVDTQLGNFADMNTVNFHGTADTDPTEGDQDEHEAKKP
ncbi:hypothetical protein [Pararcticibacter amylolyticus]|uniref:Uncharacterized protein n=1 Tax=Pararcticibacter amylolyticus TaxID=2173175 RepID=A0A2U2PJL7_9SPHI|nr:hypothetical protein [Pararcticibacter amylolyticus]PWG81595.1 hypothetical protein DDR33_07120 [Pararcticibacter amylolyticus]